MGRKSSQAAVCLMPAFHCQRSLMQTQNMCFARFPPQNCIFPLGKATLFTEFILESATSSHKFYRMTVFLCISYKWSNQCPFSLCLTYPMWSPWALPPVLLILVPYTAPSFFPRAPTATCSASASPCWILPQDITLALPAFCAVLEPKHIMK